MFTTLESKGILRTAPEEFALSAKYNPRDPFAAEGIRTCREETFHGRDFLVIVEAVPQKAELREAKTILPSAKKLCLTLGYSIHVRFQTVHTFAMVSQSLGIHAMVS